LQEICKILKLKTQILKKLKTQTQAFEHFWVHMSVFSLKNKTTFQAQKYDFYIDWFE